MKEGMGDEVRISHILEAISEIEKYISNLNQDLFSENSMARFACIKQLEIIGEASKNISETTKSNYPAIEWKQISGLRNILVHEYFGIDDKILWQIVSVDIPVLKQNLAK